VAVDTHSALWTSRIEAALKTLRDVDAVAVKADGTVIREIHVVTSSSRRPNLLVRDIQTLLLTRFQHSIDRRVVSVVTVTHDRQAPSPAAETASETQPQESVAAEIPAEPEPPLDERIRFGSVNLYVAGLRAQAQVELRWKGVSRMGSASGWSTRDGASRLIAAATVNAIQEFLDDDIALSVGEVGMMAMGRHQVALVGLTMLAHRQEKMLVGSCAVEQDAQQAVVLATLAALNRVVGGLHIKEPTEYVLRPAAVREDSGAQRSR
jgi:hypothetical protein